MTAMKELSRRGFLKTSAVLAMPAFVPINHLMDLGVLRKERSTLSTQLLRNPSLILAQGTYHGHRWMVTTGSGLGYRCGYVALPHDHPWIGFDYDQLSVSAIDGGLTYPDVHCGLTFSGLMPTEYGDVPDQWWVGFDCAHAGDAVDLSIVSPEYREAQELMHSLELPLSITLNSINWPNETIKDTEFVINECRHLINQLPFARSVVPD